MSESEGHDYEPEPSFDLLNQLKTIQEFFDMFEARVQKKETGDYTLKDGLVLRAEFHQPTEVQIHNDQTEEDFLTLEKSFTANRIVFLLPDDSTTLGSVIEVILANSLDEQVDKYCTVRLDQLRSLNLKLAQ